MEKRSKYIIGIDEVGRGPLAGPVAVCALAICQNKSKDVKTRFSTESFKNFKDSKKLSHHQRLSWLARINMEKAKGNIFYKVSFESNRVIDQRGLSFAIKSALNKSLVFLNKKPNECLILLDGGLKAPLDYKKQKTIIKGDETQLAISLASIVAKVARDAHMVKLGLKYPEYGFSKHKGYGTKDHFKILNKYGLTPLHRKSFLKNFN